MVLTFFDKAGSSVLRAMETTGDFAVLSGRTFAAIFKRPFDGANLMRQFQAVGVNSLPVVVLTSLAVSMVFAVQLAFGFKQFQAEGLASQVEGLAVMRELAPVITGLMLAGRVGSAMAAELGTMQVTEQIDALECLATDPIHYLFVPRLIASAVMLPSRIHPQTLHEQVSHPPPLPGWVLRGFLNLQVHTVEQISFNNNSSGQPGYQIVL